MSKKDDVWATKEYLLQGLNLIAYKCRLGPFLGPLKAQWEVTYRCNSKCRFCSRWKTPIKKQKDELTTDQAFNLISQLKELHTQGISFSGGEPLMRDDLFELIKYAQSIGIEYLNIVTNGTLLTKDISSRLVDSGIKYIYISFEGSEEIHNYIRGLKSAYEKTIKGTKNVIEIRTKKGKNYPKILFNSTITKLNYAELSQIFSIAKNFGLDGVNCQPLHEIERCAFTTDDKKLSHGAESNDVTEQIIRSVSLVKEEYRDLLPHEDRYYELIGTFLRNPSWLRKIMCWAGVATVTIDPYGNVYPCEAMGKIGNIKNEKLSTIWQSNEFNEVRKRIRQGKHPICWLSCYGPFNLMINNLFSNPLYAIPHIIKKYK